MLTTDTWELQIYRGTYALKCAYELHICFNDTDFHSAIGMLFSISRQMYKVDLKLMKIVMIHYKLSMTS
jgi:hypothetical protein